MTIEYMGIDSVSGKKRYYDTDTNEYSLGEVASSGSPDTGFANSQMETFKTAYRESEASNGESESPSAARSSDASSLATSTQAPAPNDKQDVTENKTPDKISSEQTETNPQEDSTNSKSLFNDGEKFLPAAERNILNNYRSWTYNFALGALTPEAVSNNRFLERDIKAYPVLNSAGKGTNGMGVSLDGLNKVGANYQESKALVDGFNKNSPGRFDLFIDNVEINSLVGCGSEQSGSSIATSIHFDVIEPYSMNGFIEALQVAAKASGYSDYTQASYALRVQFQGWPDKSTNAQSKPEIVPMSTRYFPILITGVQVDVTESGTRYKVKSVPLPQLGLGTPNGLSSDIKVSGKTVGEILKNFFDAINQMIIDRTKESTDQIGRDRYEIAVPKLSSVGNPQNTRASVLNGTTSTSFINDIVKAPMNDGLKSPNVQQTADFSKYPNAKVLGSTSTTSVSDSNVRIDPNDGTVTFAAGAQIHDCIAAVVRDSTYTKNLLKQENLDKVKKGDGMVTYFTIRMETDLLGKDTVNNKHFQVYRYVLEPYQMHYTRVPGQEQAAVDLTPIKNKIKREYNYIYTGKNTDVLKFNLKFDHLYFTAMPAMLGNRPATNSTVASAATNNQIKIKQEGSQAVINQQSQSLNEAPIAKTMVDPGKNSFRSEAKAGSPQGDPYALMAQNFHDAALSTVDLIKGTLEILGDPYFLVTGGMGNTDLDLKEPMMTKDGQAPTTQGDVYININFRNPVDINPKTGLVDFGSNPVSFSGVYRVIKLKNNFKDGIFTQGLEILRIPGQIVEGKKKESLASNFKSSPVPGQQLIKDTALSSILRSGIRPSDFNLANLLGRGLPSIGLPGNLSNFTNSLVSTAAGATASVGTLLNQVQGATGAVGNLTNQLGVSPVSGVNALTSGVRLATSGLSQISQVPNTLAATVAAAGTAVGNLANIPSAATKLAGNVADSITSLPGNAIAAVNNVAPAITGQVTALAQTAGGLATQGVNAVSNLVGDAKNAVLSLQNTMPTDLNAIGTKLGIDTSAIAGLSTDLASKMTTELAGLAEKIPPNTDLGSLKEQGVSFASLVKDKLPNLPAVQPKDVAPLPITDPGISDIVSKYGSISSLLSGNINLPPMTDLNNVVNPLGTISAGLTSKVGSIAVGYPSAQSVMGAVDNANSLVNNTIGSAVGIANNVGSLAQNAVQGFSPASVGLGSVESNVLNVAGLTQNVTSQVSSLGISVSNQYGSLQSSPLAKLIRTNNIEGSA